MQPATGLLVLNFFVADVQGGLGPFLATWLAQSAQWDAAKVGLMMTLGGIVGLVFNAPAGAAVDRVHRPRLWVAVAAAAIVAGTLAMLPARGFLAVLAAQTGAAAGGALMAPALVALTLGIVGKAALPAQQGRNQAWNHAGNVAAAGLVAGVTFEAGAAASFWVLAGMAACSALTLLAMPTGSVDIERASGRAKGQQGGFFRAVLANRQVLLLGLVLLLFHLGNAAMLPLLGERLAASGQGDATRWMAICIVVAQVTMVAVAIAAGRAADRIDRAWLLLAACAVLPVRGLLAAWAPGPVWMVPVEMLDACGAGTLGVAIPILVADYTWGSGRTQTALGTVATFQGIGAALSTTLGGVLVSRFGWSAGFLGLTLPAVFALGLAARLGGGAPAMSAEPGN